MPSLSVPKRPAGLTAEAARDYGAPLLFEARARSANPRFALDDGNAAVVAEICIRLDGIPLAIELAAARMKVLTPVQLAQKLDERFRVLTGGSRTALPRQQTMMALIDWSYDLLSDDERWLFRHLSIFAGGFMMDAATVVGANESIGEFEILDLLASLVDKSLVVSEPFGDEHRYRLLESMRQYARQKLVEANERPRAAALHADVYTELAERLEREYEDVPYGEWLTRAEAELENVRAALSWAFSGDGDPLLGQRLAATLYRVFGVFAAAEARRWIETAQSRVSDATPGVLAAKLKLGEAFLASAFNQFRASLAAARQALESFTELDDERGIMEAQRLAGRALVYLGQVDEGAHLLSDSSAAKNQVPGTSAERCAILPQHTRCAATSRRRARSSRRQPRRFKKNPMKATLPPPRRPSPKRSTAAATRKPRCGTQRKPSKRCEPSGGSALRR
jgi:non-specific serine/threonine protein kinase